MTDRLRVFLEQTGLDARLLDLEAPARTVAAAARILDVDARQVLKSLVVVSDAGEAGVLVLSGPDRVDLEAAAAALGWPEARMARPDEARAATGYAIGGTPPVGHATTLPVIIDERAAGVDVGYAGGGRPERLLAIRPGDILEATGGKVARIAEGRP